MFKRARLVSVLVLALPSVARAQDVSRAAVVLRAEKMFGVADRDRDGWLSRDEYRAAVLATARRYDPRIRPDDKVMAAALARFDALAAPSGGRLSGQAFVAEATGHFDGADLNRNGTVTPDEARRAAALRAKGKAPGSR